MKPVVSPIVPSEIQKTLDWLLKIENYSLARELALTAAEYLPMDRPETSDFMAMILHRAKCYPEALIYAQKTVSLVPGQIEAHYNLARCLNSVGEAAMAEKQIEVVIKSRPEWLDPQLDYAMYICFQGRFDEAENLLIELQKKLPSNDPHQNVIKFNLGWHMIRHGYFKEGISALSIGRKLRVYGAEAKSYPKPKLIKALPIAGKKILLVGEAGAGDEIINVRFAKTIQDRGGQVVCVSGQKLEGVFSRVKGVQQSFSYSEVPNLVYDYWAPMMELASILDLDQNEIPAESYIQPEPQVLRKWKTQISDGKALKVGLRWQGNSLYEQDLYRSVPFHLYRKFFALKNTEFYSLQRDSGLDELSTTDPVKDLSKGLVSWEDTTAAISLLDVVITSCTSIAHLAGALGKKTFLFTPMVSYYIWASPGDKSFWYPDVRLFRQKKFHDWSLEAEEIFQELKRMSQ